MDVYICDGRREWKCGCGCAEGVLLYFFRGRGCLRCWYKYSDLLFQFFELLTRDGCHEFFVVILLSEE